VRTITDAALAALIAPTVQPVYLVAMEFTSGTKYMWTGIGTVVWDGEEWEGMGDFLGVSSITQTSELSAEGISISMSGINAEDVSSAISDVATYLTVDVYLGFLCAGAIIADPVHCFSGHLDVPTLQDDGDTATISITAENDLILLTKASMMRYTNDCQQIFFPLDTGFQYVPFVQSWNGAFGGTNGGSTSGAPGDSNFF
jgi:hypothetical protein